MGFIDSYAQFAVSKPCILLPCSIFFALGLGIIAWVAKDVRPEFDKASKGFETRGASPSCSVMCYAHLLTSSVPTK